MCLHQEGKVSHRVTLPPAARSAVTHVNFLSVSTAQRKKVKLVFLLHTMCSKSFPPGLCDFIYLYEEKTDV